MLRTQVLCRPNSQQNRQQDEVLGKFSNLNFRLPPKKTTEYSLGLFSKATVGIRFPAKKNAECPKAPPDFPPSKDGILHPLWGCLGTPLLLPQSVYGRTLTSQAKFRGLIGYQHCLWCFAGALCARAPL